MPWVAWQLSSNFPALPVAKVSVTNYSQVNFYMYWNLGDFWAASSFADPSPRHKRNTFVSTKTWVTKRFGLNDRHWRDMDVIGGGTRHNESSQKHASTCLLIFALIHWSLKCANVVEQSQPLKLLLGLLHMACLTCELDLAHIMCPLNPRSVKEPCAHVLLCKFQALVDIPQVAQKDSEVHLVPLLVGMAGSSESYEALTHLVHELALNIEDALRTSVDWHTSCMKVLPAIAAQRAGKKLPLDPDVVAELRGIVSGKLVRTHKALNRATSALGLSVHAGDHFTDAAETRQLALSCRRAFGASSSLGIAVDCKRFGGKHWLAGILADAEAGQFAVCNPVALLLLYPQTVLITSNSAS